MIPPRKRTTSRVGGSAPKGKKTVGSQVSKRSSSFILSEFKGFLQDMFTPCYLMYSD